MKKIVFIASLFIMIICSIFTVNAETYHYQVIPGGESIGISIETGVCVTGKYSVDLGSKKINPWENTTIDIGDQILKIDLQNLYYTTDLISYLKETNSSNAILTVKHDNKIYTTTIDVITTQNNDKSIGLSLKDHLQGIGTLSFIDKESKNYAALGHGIYQGNELIHFKTGILSLSKIASVRKAEVLQFGEKRAIFDNERIGSITSSTACGTYGRFDSVLDKQEIKIANPNEIKIGKAKIATVVHNTKVEYFDVEIIELKNQDHIEPKGIKIKVTDTDLLSKTGGIIKGMSGSPIIQNDELVGVVSHVTLENPTIGYGMYAKMMYEEMMQRN